ncbi:MAG TPA: hypothetical protein VFL14_15945 [Xanthomonadales bacterium]|nr:hypothetical protein [Xanthomonadales bacterium]
MTTDVADREHFIARQAVFLQRRGADAEAVRARLAAVFASNDLAALDRLHQPSPGSFRAAFTRAAAGLDVAPGTLGAAGVAFEHAVADAYLGLWRALVGFAHYVLVLAIVTTLSFSVLTIFVVPSLTSILSTNTPAFSRLVFETGLGTALQLVLWLLVLWIFLSVATARRAILMRAWPHLFSRIGLLRGTIARHRILLHAWAAGMLLGEGVDARVALDRARDALVAWTRGSAEAIDFAVARKLLDDSAALGTLGDELAHRVASELADAPLALAARRERLALWAAFATAALVAPILFAMYLMIFGIAGSV